MNDRKKYYSVAIFILLLSAGAFSQKRQVKFYSISLEQGLSQSSVFSIAQDNSGFLWFGTMDGLNLYDGNTIKVYRTISGDSSSLPDNYINVLLCDKKSTLWIGTKGKGLAFFDKMKGNFTTFNHLESDSFSIVSNSIHALYADKKNDLWIGTEGGLSLYNDSNGYFKNYTEQNSNLFSNSVHAIYFDEDGWLWAGTDKGLCLKKPENEFFEPLFPNTSSSYELNKFEILSILGTEDHTIWVGTSEGLFLVKKTLGEISSYIHDPSNEECLNSNHITSIIKGNNGNIWIGTDKGLNSFDPEIGKFSDYHYDSSDPNSLCGDIVSTLFIDKSEIIWVGTSLAGISYCNNENKGFSMYRRISQKNNSLSDSKIRSIYQDKKGTFWIGTIEGGLNRWNRKNDEFVHYQYEEGITTSLSNNHIRSILEDSQGNFWVGTDGGGLNKMDRYTGKFSHFRHDSNNKNSISNDRVWKVFEDHKGNVWVGTLGGGLNKFNYLSGNFISFRKSEKEGSLSDDEVTTIYEDSKGILWIGTFGGGLNRFNVDDETFTVFKNNPDDSTSLSNNRIYSIFEDSEYTLWVGTKGDLNKMDRSTGQFIHFSENDGLPNDVVMGIIEDEKGYLWLSTNIGLSRFDKKNLTFRNYDVRDGLQSNEFLVGSYCEAGNGEILFGGINGFNAFFPNEIKDNKHIPDIVITGFKIWNKNVQLDTIIQEKKQLNLSYKDEVFSFDFVALNYLFSEKNQLAYKMEGFESEWNYVGNRRFASYSSLPAGDYIFRVKGSNNDNIWNEKGTAIRIHIDPPFWKTLWFIALEIVIVILLVILYINRRERKLKKDKRILEQKVKERTHEIQQQKEEIEAQRDEIQEQKNQVEHQRDKISEQKKEIMDSIRYAKRIQSAILPPDDYLAEILPEHFVLFKPKDIVSGDFYWAFKTSEKVFFSAVDCTGHGVPGAFMSIVGHNGLNRSIREYKKNTPGTILDQHNEIVVETLRQTQKIDVKDGMDLALCAINTELNQLEYSGANNPLYVVRSKGHSLIKNGIVLEPALEGETHDLYEIKADKQPIGAFEDRKEFTNHVFTLMKGDTIYIASDGYADQFGGPKGKKFKYLPFKALILENQGKTMVDQREVLNAAIENWRGSLEQIDDICVIGIRV